MYTSKNYKTKKAMKDDLLAGKEITLFAPGLESPKDNGMEFVEGPHGVHKWYAQVEMKDGKVIKIK